MVVDPQHRISNESVSANQDIYVAFKLKKITLVSMGFPKNNPGLQGLMLSALC